MSLVKIILYKVGQLPTSSLFSLTDVDDFVGPGEPLQRALRDNDGNTPLGEDNERQQYLFGTLTASVGVDAENALHLQLEFVKSELIANRPTYTSLQVKQAIFLARTDFASDQDVYRFFHRLRRLFPPSVNSSAIADVYSWDRQGIPTAQREHHLKMATDLKKAKTWRGKAQAYSRWRVRQDRMTKSPYGKTEDFRGDERKLTDNTTAHITSEYTNARRNKVAKESHTRLIDINMLYRYGDRSWLTALKAIHNFRFGGPSNADDIKEPKFCLRLATSLPLNTYAKADAFFPSLSLEESKTLLYILRALAGTDPATFHESAVPYLLSGGMIAHHHPVLSDTGVRGVLKRLVPGTRKKLPPRFEEGYLIISLKACFMHERSENAKVLFARGLLKVFETYFQQHGNDKALVSGQLEL